ncbi:hypothetical protein MetMK1DRAFT_00021950 [Metallosphaera yellowstonensis MK1]|jgi:hypothetical protein|uniref:Transcription factor Pcc1 n=1 Tax=Metallosphaera yellowstonensis MK1 TaxID=671065 RepID=H2C6L2_9CREN|nr:hypothetical protein [Metallosphaera yellowstonensis]EHP69439.1 hypothetical protein MetMK1DRAFT_00021950 [Metallosphaera yellowstonensis MK1]
MIRIIISMDRIPEEVTRTLSKALIIEDIDKEFVRISEGPTIDIKCETVTRCRAIMNSYIFWIYSVLRTLEEVEHNG